MRENKPILHISGGGEINTSPTAEVHRSHEGDQHVHNYLERNVHPDLVGKNIDLRSLDKESLTNEILQQVKKSTYSTAIITLPRNNIKEISLEIQKHKEEFPDKSVVLVSSRFPLDGTTDARFNLGFAIGVGDYIEKGNVVVIDSGKILEPHNLDDSGQVFTEIDINSIYSQYLDDVSILLGGGTIAGQPVFEMDGNIQMKERDPIEPYLKFLRLETRAKIKKIAMKDSRDIGARERHEFFRVIRDETDEDVVFITHGTYTMSESARNLKRRIDKLPADHPAKKKTFVFIGSMKPLTGYEETDGDFNLGYAWGSIAVAQNKLPGVFVAMNGEFFDPDNVDKNIDKGIFEKKKPNPFIKMKPKEIKEPTKKDIEEINEYKFIGFKSIPKDQIKEHETRIELGNSSFSGGLKLQVNNDLFPNEEELIEEARKISKVLNRAIEFDFNGERGDGTFFVFYYSSYNDAQFIPKRKE